MSDTYTDNGSDYVFKYNFNPSPVFRRGSGGFLTNPIFSSDMEHGIMDFDLGCAEVDTDIECDNNKE